ncbi:ATP-grasp fold amidoligase family protein [Solibacillus silvestris]|uniref:ATP-grasp fold amidoligase family protein n=1 Tax=Solibacillus silvestris TaxID=76853 RepID=UPI003F7DDCBD
MKNPITFNEKLMWLKLYEDDSLKTICTDKYLVRDYIKQAGYSQILIDLYKVYENVDDIDFRELPNSFVMKCTHGSGFNIICACKDTLDRGKTILQLKKWMETDFSVINCEPHYSKIKPRIIVERFLGEEMNEKLPIDYKIHCFHGQPHIFDVVLNRGTKEKKHIMLNSGWQVIPYTNDSKDFAGGIKKPEKLDEMLKMAAELSKDFTYVRVDFYYYNDQIYFGELTFTPGACIDTEYSEGVDFKMGKLLDLTALKNETLSKRLVRV